jgi:hypothetical protein
VGPVLSKHREVIGVEAWTSDAKLRETLERDAADNVKRMKTHDVRGLDWSTVQGLGYIERFLETKTVWHPVGL